MTGGLDFETHTGSFFDELKREYGLDFDSPVGELAKRQPKMSPLNSPGPPPKSAGVGLSSPLPGTDADIPNLATTDLASDGLPDDADSVFSS
jgi:hypothetical protein